MMKNINKFCMALLCASACSGNTSADIESADSSSLADILDNGSQLNGFALNGFALNGFALNGFALNGFALNGFALNGFALNGITLGGNAALTAQRTDSRATVTGKDFIGVNASVSLSNGTSAVLRVDDVAYNTTAGMYVYTVSIQTDSGWAPICGTANGAPVPAVPVPGSWDMVTGAHVNSNAFTIGCVNAAIGKCVLWGYRPWDSKTECNGSSCRSQSLVNWQQACTRMVRADYCGDGVSHTRNGTTINVWDALGIQTEADTDWELEAEWAIDGAHCINHTRWSTADPNTTDGLTDLAYVTKTCPSRLASSGKDKCGQDSDFLTKKGLYSSSSKRKLLRNESALNQ